MCRKSLWLSCPACVRPGGNASRDRRRVLFGLCFLQQIRQFHRVDTANLIETVTFRSASCRRPSSRHRSCLALWTFEMAFCPSTIPQCATELSNCWVPQIDVGSQQMTLLCGRWGFLILFGFRHLVGAINLFCKSSSLCAAAPDASIGAVISTSAVSRDLCKKFSHGWRPLLRSPPPANGTVPRCVTVLLWRLPLAGCVLPLRMTWPTSKHDSWCDSWSPTWSPSV